MTLEDLISNLKNDKLDLEIKLCSLCDFYFDSSSYQENAKIIDDSGNYLSYVFDEDQIDQFCVFIPNYLDL